MRNIIIYLLSVIFIKGCLFTVYYIPSSSMSPALNKGDYIIVAKFSYNLRSPMYVPFTNISIPFISVPGLKAPRRGDVAVFYKPDSTVTTSFTYHEVLVKRIEGMPGDTVKKFHNITTVNEQRYIIPPYYQQFLHSHKEDSTVNRISKKAYFMAGDNRKNSFDSRYWGLVPKRNLIGRAVLVLWPWPPHRL